MKNGPGIVVTVVEIGSERVECREGNGESATGRVGGVEVQTSIDIPAVPANPRSRKGICHLHHIAPAGIPGRWARGDSAWRIAGGEFAAVGHVNGPIDPRAFGQ